MSSAYCAQCMIAALYLTMSVCLSVDRNEFQRVTNALKVIGRIMFHCIKHYKVCLVHIVRNAYIMDYALCMVYIENQMHRTETQ